MTILYSYLNLVMCTRNAFEEEMTKKKEEAPGCTEITGLFIYPEFIRLLNTSITTTNNTTQPKDFRDFLSCHHTKTFMHRAIDK